MPKKVNDNFYRKGQFVLSFNVSCPSEKALDKDVVLRAIGVFISDLRDNTKLKASEYFDIEPIKDKKKDYGDDKLMQMVDKQGTEYVQCYKVDFIIYNKLGVTNLRTLTRYFTDRTESTYLRVIDPQTKIRVRLSNFTITFYFIDFVFSPYGSFTWSVLQDLLGERNRGYEKLKIMYNQQHSQRRNAMRRTAITNPAITLLTNATKRLQTTQDKDEAVLAINDIIDAANDILDDITRSASYERVTRRKRISEKDFNEATQRRVLRRILAERRERRECKCR